MKLIIDLCKIKEKDEVTIGYKQLTIFSSSISPTFMDILLLIHEKQNRFSNK